MTCPSVRCLGFICEALELTLTELDFPIFRSAISFHERNGDKSRDFYFDTKAVVIGRNNGAIILSKLLSPCIRDGRVLHHHMLLLVPCAFVTQTLLKRRMGWQTMHNAYR